MVGLLRRWFGAYVCGGKRVKEWCLETDCADVDRKCNCAITRIHDVIPKTEEAQPMKRATCIVTLLLLSTIATSQDPIITIRAAVVLDGKGGIQRNANV